MNNSHRESGTVYFEIALIEERNNRRYNTNNTSNTNAASLETPLVEVSKGCRITLSSCHYLCSQYHFHKQQAPTAISTVMD